MTRFEIERAVRDQQDRLSPVDKSVSFNWLYDAGIWLYIDGGGYNYLSAQDSYASCRDTLVNVIARAQSWLETTEEPGRVVEDPLSKNWTRVTG